MRFLKSAFLFIFVLATVVSAKGFYLETDVGVAYTRFSERAGSYNIKRADDHIEKTKEKSNVTTVKGDFQEFSGHGPFFNLKLGFGTEYVAVYGIMGATLGYGSHDMKIYSYDYECQEEDLAKCVSRGRYSLTESGSSRFIFGAGTTYYPFGEEDSPWQGVFVGGSLSYAVIETSDDNYGYWGYSSVISRSALDLTLEFGKIWELNNLFNIGVVGAMSLDVPVGVTGKEDIVFRSVWLGVRLSKK